MAIRKKLLSALLIACLISTALSAKPKKQKGFSSSAQAETTAASDISSTDSSDSEATNSDNADKTDIDDKTDSDNEVSAEQGWQMLEWDEEMPEWVMKYEVVIEQRTDENSPWEEIRRLMTEDNTPQIKIDPLLPPGFYRYTVITYNLLDVPGLSSDPFEFTIYEAHVPSVRGVEVTINHTSTIYLDEVNDGILDIRGRNLLELQQDPSDMSYTNYYLMNQRRRNDSIIPEILEYSDNNRRLKVRFDVNELDAGKYNFVAVDASGLSSALEKNNQLVIKFRKAVDFDISAGVTYPIMVFGDRLKKYLNTDALLPTGIKGMDFPLPSATVKLTLMPVKRRFGYFGIGATASYSRLYTKADGYELDGNYITGHALFVYQLPIRIKVKNSDKPRHIATIELHGGPGLAMFNDTRFHFSRGIKSEPPLNSLDISALAGISGQIYFTNRLYMEFGADFIIPFIEQLISGYIQPNLSIGWQF